MILNLFTCHDGSETASARIDSWFFYLIVRGCEIEQDNFGFACILLTTDRYPRSFPSVQCISACSSLALSRNRIPLSACVCLDRVVPPPKIVNEKKHRAVHLSPILERMISSTKQPTSYRANNNTVLSRTAPRNSNQTPLHNRSAAIIMQGHFYS